MPADVQEQLREAERLLADAEASAGQDFGSTLALESFKRHVEELRKIASREREKPFVEILDLRVSGSRFTFGTIPLEVLSDFAAELRRVFGYTCLRIVEGGLKKKRVSPDLYSTLNLRLSGLETGSSRLIIAADSNVELFSGSLASDAIDRIIAVFSANEDHHNFLQAITEMGPLAARRLKRLISGMVALDVSLDITWISRGSILGEVSSNRNRLASLAQELNTTTVKESERTIEEGTVEMLSANRRLRIRRDDGVLLRISYPRKLLDEISGLRLGQRIRTEVLQTIARYQYTGEQEVFLELVAILPSEH